MDLQRDTKLVADVMRRRFIALAPEDSLLEAERLMRMARVRFLPVSADGALLGGLSHRALLGATLASIGRGALEPWLRETRVASVMERSPGCVTPGTSLEEAAARLVDQGEGCLLVVEPGPGEARLVGVVTESDLLRAAFDPRPR